MSPYLDKTFFLSEQKDCVYLIFAHYPIGERKYKHARPNIMMRTHFDRRPVSANLKIAVLGRGHV